jgi:AraC family transcriptional activator of pobA
VKDIPIRKIHSAADEPRSAESFSIREVKDLFHGADLVQELHRHDFFYVLALQKGSGLHEIDFIPYEVCDHCIFFMRPGQVHQLMLKAGSTGFLMVFKTDYYHPDDHFLNQPLRVASHKNLCHMEADRFTRVLELLENISREYKSRQQGYHDVIKANLGILFIELIRQHRGNSDTPKSESDYTQERFEKFSALLETHITTHKQVSQYAEMLNLTPYQLNAITKKTLGKTGSELINGQIILEAKRYLRATTNQINQIAYHLGYEDASYFIRFFKKHCGHTPDAFRKNPK